MWIKGHRVPWEAASPNCQHSGYKLAKGYMGSQFESGGNAFESYLQVPTDNSAEWRTRAGRESQPKVLTSQS